MTEPCAREAKAAVRAVALARRDALTTEVRIEASLAASGLSAALADAVGGVAGKVVAGFLPIRTEIDARPLMAALTPMGASLCLPAIIDRHSIIFRALIRGAALEVGAFGTLEPGEDAPAARPDIILMPLAAFDRAGRRAGYGAGFYDRAIASLHAQHHRPKLIGMAFDCQEVEAVPVEDHDIPLDAILTESGLRCFAASL